MRVLVVHNRYRSGVPSGENVAVEQEAALLTSAGHDVATHLEDSDTIRGVRGYAAAAVGPVYSPGGVRRFRNALRETDPDVVHFHNVFPLISPASVRAAASTRAAVVHTVHNYRHSCVNGMHFRDGHACTDCLGTVINLPAVRHSCYRDSRLQSVPMAVGLTLHRPTWRDDVDAMIALTPFMSTQLLQLGIAADRLHTRASWVPDVEERTVPGRDFLYLGRLDQAKGVHLLLDAWKRPRGDGRALRIAGEGPLRQAVETASASDPSIVYLGAVPRGVAARELEGCAAVVLPSLWFEGYPLVVAEARAHGRAVVTVSGGAAASIVTAETGWVCAPTAEELGSVLRTATDPDLAERGGRARERYVLENSPQRALESLERIYARARTGRTRRGGAQA